MENNQENQDEVFKMDNPSDNGFKKVNTSDSSSQRSPEYVFKKPKVGFGKGVFVPFISGVVGTALVVGVCFGVPTIKEKLVGTSSNNAQTTIFTSEGKVNNSVDVSDYSGTAISVANKVLPSVVGIEVQFSVTSTLPSFMNQQSSSSTKATGSGVIISEDGYILTNNHIIDSSSSSSSSYYEISSANKILIYLYEQDEPVEAKVIGSDSVTDLAILKIEADNLTPAELGDSDSVQVGEFAMAIGNPLDMQNTVTSGIISGLNREITDTDGTSYTLLQTDAAINSNVLNVIKEPQARQQVLKNIKKLVKPGAPVYITVYEGSGKGNEGPTKAGYQLNRKTSGYIDEISQVFPNVKRRGKLITAINESFSSSGLRQANIDAIDYFIEFEDLYPFPKGKFLAHDWEELRDGISMGMDSDLEIAEGIMKYLQKEIDFNSKHKEIYEDDPQAELTLEIYNKVRREYEKEISKYESISSEAVNEAVNGPKIKITGGSCDTKWIYDTMTTPMSIYFVINSIPCEFKFSANHGQYVVNGVDCNHVLFEGDRFYKDLTHSGGTARSYALRIPGNVLTSQPKQNQKDYRFTGQYYSTVPAIKYCKESLKELLTEHPDYFHDDILDKLGLAQSLEEANYGGAFDIEDDQYFTREDIIDFGNKVCEILGEIYPDTFDISDTYIYDNNILFLEVTSKQGNEGSANFKIDMRKIKKPSDLLKFADEMAFYLRQDLEELYTNNSIFTESASDWRYVASKSVPDFDGFLTDYTWYENTKDGRHVFILGDNDLYDDVDSNYADWETDSYSEARSWFDNYHGFDEEDM